jgi:hypothetical protein
MAIGIENKTSNKTFHPFTGNFWSSLLSVGDFSLRLLSPFVNVTCFFIYNVNKNTVKLPWVFGARAKNNTDCWSFSYGIRSFPMVISSHGINPREFFCIVWFIPKICAFYNNTGLQYTHNRNFFQTYFQEIYKIVFNNGGFVVFII